MRRFLLLLSTSLLAGCVVGPDYHKPDLPSASGYGSLATAPAEDAAAKRDPDQPKLVEGMDIPAQWWQLFHCAALDALVARALENSPNVASARAALLAAREQVRAQVGAYYPTVSAGMAPSHNVFSETLSSPTASGTDVYNLTTTQLSVSYTPDLFGADARAVENLVAERDQQLFDLEAARLTLAANVVQASIQDASLRAEIATTEDIIKTAEGTLASFQKQLRLGQLSRADVAVEEAQLAQLRGNLPGLEKQFRINRDQLAALIGQTPGETLDVQFTLDQLSLPETLPLSVPAKLVEHRPDIRVAEAALQAASAEIGVAVAARWPNIELSGEAGGNSLKLYPTFSPASKFYDIATTITQPIFEGGTLYHREEAAKDLYDQATAQYRQTIVTAFQNTADCLHALWTDADATRRSSEAEAAAATSLAISQKQLGLGDVSALTVLAAELTDDQARLTLLQARANRYGDVVALFQALGGGWWNAPADNAHKSG